MTTVDIKAELYLTLKQMKDRYNLPIHKLTNMLLLYAIHLNNEFAKVVEEYSFKIDQLGKSHGDN